MAKPQLVTNDKPQIEKGIPVPPRNQWTTYPFAKMEVGDSALMPPKDGEIQMKLRERVSAAITWTKRGNTKNFCTRAVDGGIRVWRIA